MCIRDSTYTKPGIYTVLLNADGPGGNDSVERTDLISVLGLSLIHISEPTRLLSNSYAVFCLKKKK